MSWSWLDLAWPWIGLAVAVALLLLLFATGLLRGDRALPRWRDGAWLSWLAIAAYMLHEVEEYGIDALGRTHQFPDALCTTLGAGVYPACPIPPAVYLAVNLVGVWLGGLVCALLARRHPLVGLGLYAVIFTNALVHLAPMIATGRYNPGALTAVLLFLPLCAWVVHARFGRGGLARSGIAVLVASGVLVHVLLMGSILLFLDGRLGASAMLAVQLLLPLLYILLPWAAERRAAGGAALGTG